MIDIIAISILNIVCFLIGAAVGQRVFEKKPVIVNPIQEIKTKIEEKEVSKEEDKFRIIAENIDNYSGSNIGQQVIPK